MKDDTQEIVLLFPQGKSITVKGKEVTIKPYGFGKFPKILALLKGLKLGDDAPTNAKEAMAIARKVDVVGLIADNSDAVIELCGLALGQSREWFDDLMPDEAVELVAAIIEVNADFFVKRLQPKLLTALSLLSASVGGMLSQPSSQQAIA